MLRSGKLFWELEVHIKYVKEWLQRHLARVTPSCPSSKVTYREHEAACMQGWDERATPASPRHCLPHFSYYWVYLLVIPFLSNFNRNQFKNESYSK